MPHLTLEYTYNLPGLQAADVLAELNGVLMASELFEEADIKSRAIPLQTFLLGTAPRPRAFVHAKLALLSGRPVETKRRLSEKLLLALQKTRSWGPGLQVQLCVEVQDIERDSYAKATVGDGE